MSTKHQRLASVSPQRFNLARVAHSQIFSGSHVGHVLSRRYGPSASHGPQLRDEDEMGLLAGPMRAGERFSGLEIREHPLPPPFEGALASIRRLSSLGPLRRDTCRVVSHRPTRPGSDLALSSIKQYRLLLKARAHTSMRRYACGLTTHTLDKDNQPRHPKHHTRLRRQITAT